MKRKFLSILLTLTMALTLLPTAAMAEGETATLQSQIATSGTVTLDKDYTEDITIPANANITLDLNGETLSNTNSGKATLSVEGTAVVKNGTISGGTGYYNIEVKAGGSLTLEDVTATAGNNGSSMIDNWGTLTITSGTYTGGLNVVKSEEGSTLMINGGKFTLNYSTSGYTGVILNYGTATITDGEFIQNATSGRWNHPQVVATGIVEGYTAITKITGGTFTNNKSGESIFHGIGKATSDNFEVSGGNFNKSVSSGYLKDGFVCEKDSATNTYKLVTGATGVTLSESEKTINNVNKPATNNNGSGAYVGIIVICKPDGTSANGYIGDAVVNIKGGTFENTFANGETIVVADFGKEGNDIGDAKVIISDDAKVKGKIAHYTSENNTDASFTVTGGYFTSDPSAYLAANKGLVTSDQSAFAYKVGDKVTNVETAVTAGEATVTIPADVSGIITEAAVKDAAKAADTTKTLTDTVAASGMTNDPAVVGTKKAAEAALVAENIPVNSGDTVTVVVQPYLEVNVKSADAGKLTLEISAKYNVVATTDDPTTIAPAKTATLKSGVPLSINKPIELTIALPTGFATASSIYVQHKGYEYTATVDASGATATFINPHGFSTFTVTPTASAVAEVDGTNYTDLQKAVDAVSNNGTVKLLNDTSASAVVSRAVKFTLDKNSKSFTGAITAGSGYKLSVDGDVYTFTVRSSSGSSGGSSSSSRRYDVSAPSVKHGDVTVSPKTASKGDTVTITVKPDSGYELDTLTVKDASGSKIKVKDKGDGKFTFTMPASKVTVSAEFAEIETLDFADVPTDAYYYEAVKWAAKKGITGGIGNGLFGPNQPCTRAQIVTFLWRAAGSPEPKTMSSFADVSMDAYYAKAVAWAVENGITTGTGDGKFSPDATCTRAQSVTFLFRAIGKLVDSKAEFSDVLADSYYANAVDWAVENGVTNGIGDGLFGPDNSCTRAQIVTFLFRAYQGK